MIVIVLVAGCTLAAALYMEKLAHEWRETPIEEPVSAGYGNWLLLLCLALGGLGVLAVSVGLAP